MVKLSCKIILLLIIFNQICLSQINNIEKEMKSGKKIFLKSTLSLGAWSGDEHKTFFKINDIKTDKDGNIYVLDSGNYRIQKFSREGEYIATIGQKGQGPGEFENPISMFIDEKDTLYVMDQSLLKITWFDPKGHYVSSIRLTSQNPFDFVVDSHNQIVVLEANEENILNVYDKNGSVLFSFCNIREFAALSKKHQAPQNEIEKRFQTKFETITLSKGALALNKSIVFLTFKYPYRILMYNNNGILLKEIKRTVTYPIKPPEIIAREKENQGSFRIVSMRTIFGNSFGIDICIVGNLIFNLVASPKSVNGDEGNVIDIFDFNGKFISQIELEFFTRKIHVSNKLELYCVVESVDQFTNVPDEMPPSVIKYNTSLIKP